jgi:hypothetical protein
MSRPVPASNSFADFFSEKQLEILKTSTSEPSVLKVGSVYRVDLGEEDRLTPDPGYKTNNKIVVVVGFDNVGNAIGIVLVNTLAYSNDDPMLKAADYPEKVIVKNSYVGIDDIFVIPDINFNYGNSDFRGEISKDDMIIILEGLLQNKDIPKSDKRRFRIYNELQKLKEETE